MDKKAVLLISGGLDSATTLAYLASKNYQIYAMSFDYGQRHREAELNACKELIRLFANIKEHKIVKIDLRAFGGSALTDDIAVPKLGYNEQAKIGSKIPVTYVPARNTIFLSYALGWAEIVNTTEIYIGANYVDYSGYPDCRPEYLEAFAKMANLATKAGAEGKKEFKIQAPLIKLSKAEIIKLGIGLGLDYSITMSCYDPIENLACGHCEACILRKAGFEEAGVKDPTRYFERK